MDEKNEPQTETITVHEFFELLGIPFDIIYPNIPIPKNSRELNSKPTILKDEDYA